MGHHIIQGSHSFDKAVNNVKDMPLRLLAASYAHSYGYACDKVGVRWTCSYESWAMGTKAYTRLRPGCLY